MGQVLVELNKMEQRYDAVLVAVVASDIDRADARRTRGRGGGVQRSDFLPTIPLRVDPRKAGIANFVEACDARLAAGFGDVGSAHPLPGVDAVVHRLGRPMRTIGTALGSPTG